MIKRKEAMKEKVLKILNNFGWQLLLLASLLAIWGGAVYYAYALNWLGVILALVLSLANFIWLEKRRPLPTSSLNAGWTLGQADRWPIILYAAMFLLLTASLLNSASSAPLVSPWEVVRPSFFAFYAVISLLAIRLLSSSVGHHFKQIILSAHFFLSFAVAALVYKIGYGFDPFIHQATMELIDKQGLVLPKTPYYLGLYGLTLIIHKISFISIYWLNKFLVPILAALFIPLVARRFLNQGDQANRTADWLAALGLLGLTYSPFIATTPQNLSYVFLIAAVFSGLSRKSSTLLVFILALATFAIHPLSGLPALAWWLWVAAKRHLANWRLAHRRILSLIIFGFSAISLPLALWLAAGSDFKGISLSWSFLAEPFARIFSNLSTAGSEDFILNSLYFFHYNYGLLVIIAIIASFAYFLRQKKKQALDDTWLGLAYMNLALIVAYVISSQISFSGLIDYEQANYAGRILILILIFCLPSLALTGRDIIAAILRQKPLIKLIWLLGGLALLAASLYLSYPRFDRYFNSRGYSTGAGDIEVVKAINGWAKGRYVVLANQQVSAAALKTLGFDHYYPTAAGALYFYPIPTGSPLYQGFLDMVYKSPGRETAEAAMDLMDVDEVFLVVNRYWYQSSRVIAAAKLLADDWQEVAGGYAYVFRYER